MTARPRGRGPLPGLVAVLTALPALLLAVPAAASAGPVGGAAPLAPADAAPAADAPAVGVRTAAGAGDVEVALDAITPTVLEPGTDLEVTATLTNSGTAAVASPRVIVHLSTAAYISRSSLDVWRGASPSATAGRVVAELDLDAPIPAGGSVTVTATVAADRVGLPRSATAWGARGLAVEVVDTADAARTRLGLARSFVVWFPDQDVTPTSLSILVPVTGPAPTQDAADEVAGLTARGGRLDDVLRATATHPDVTWAVDPWLVGLAAGTSDGDGSDADGGSADGGSGDTASEGASEAARAWAARLVAATEHREVQALPWGDADVTALAHAGRLDLLADAADRSAEASTVLGIPDRDVLVLPGETEPDLVTAAAAAGSALVVGPGALQPSPLLTFTPSGVASLSTTAGEVTAVVADTRVSAAVRGGRVLDPDPQADAPQVTGATAAADLLAELAVVTRERPSDARTLLAVLPRDWHPDPSVTSAQLDALEDAPFVHLASVAELAAAPVPDVDRAALPAEIGEDGEVAAAALDAVATAVADRRAIATMVDDPAALVGDVVTELLAPAALAWREDPEGRAGLVAASQATTAALRESVHVPELSDVRLVSRSGELPLRVATTLDQDVHVVVSLEPGNARLVADDEVPITVPAGGETTVQVPVHGIQSADVDVRVVLSTPDGVVVDDSTVVTVRVRAEWEGIGAAVAAAVLSVGLLIGLVRTIRKGRRSRRVAAGLGPAEAPAEVPAGGEGGG